MKKISKKFKVAIPMPGFVSGKHINYGNLIISGTGYYWPEEDYGDQYDFDIDTVLFNKVDIKPVLDYQTGNAKEHDYMYNACLAHMAYLFGAEYQEGEREIELSEKEFPDLMESINHVLK